MDGVPTGRDWMTTPPPGAATATLGNKRLVTMAKPIRAVNTRSVMVVSKLYFGLVMGICVVPETKNPLYRGSMLERVTLALFYPPVKVYGVRMLW
jgi:hypothetical protein